MNGDSTGATIWWTFWNAYLTEVFGPAWKAVQAPGPDVTSLDLSTARAALNQNLETWTLHDPDNAAFTPAGGARRDADTTMLAAFRTTVRQLTAQLGPDTAGWRWDRVHTSEIPSLLEAGPLGHGPEPAGGNRFTVNAAEGELTSSFGPSYRLVVSWTGVGAARASSIYPGGQSENPASEWYQDLVPDWSAGRLRDLPAPPDQTTPAGVRWTLRPEEGR
jgi:penicillin amidase